jgi:cardiolipin synthase
MYNDFKLLVDGENAFNEILSCIDNAKHVIKINMFIWRDDEIGNEIGKHLYDAANRGVKIFISIDRFGYILEKAEEYKKSFFHRNLSLPEKFKIKVLEQGYPSLSIKDRNVLDKNTLADKLINHDNVLVSRAIIKKDHSKYYIFDDNTLIFGGINIEEKERTHDLIGRVYHDYMVKITGKEYVLAFFEKYNTFKNISDDYLFGINYKNKKSKLYEMRKLYLDLINNAEKELFIIMPYFSPLNDFMKAIVSAYNRGVDVNIMIPKNSNLQNDTNYFTVRTLMKKTNNGIKVFLSPKITHAKLMLSDKMVSFGSTNVTSTSFKTLQELNLFVNNVACKFNDDVKKAVIENFSIAERVEKYNDLKYRKFIKFLESFVS